MSDGPADEVFDEVFDDIVRQAINGLPPWVHAVLDEVDVIVQDEPGPEAEALIDDPAADASEAMGPTDILGLYSGTPLTDRSVTAAGELSDVIYIYRNAHRALALADSALADEVARTLIHEIAHHFGFDEDEVEEAGFS